MPTKNIPLKQKISQLLQKHDFNDCIKNNFGAESYEIVEKVIYDYVLLQKDLDMEEAKLYEYLKMHQNACQKDIFDKLVEIIEDWFGESPLGVGTLNTLKLMTHEIYENRKLG